MNPTTHHATIYYPSALIAEDRRQALHEQRELPTYSNGAVLFADIVGFTALVEQVERHLGAKKGADAMTEQINRLFSVLIEQVQRFAGVVVSFGGDSLTCWFAQEEQSDAALQAVYCGLAMQQAMQGFAKVALPQLESISFFLKVSVAAGTATRLVVGNPHIQRLELLAGEVSALLSPIQRAAAAGYVLLDGESAKRLADRLTIAQWPWREGIEIVNVSGIKGEVPSQPTMVPLPILPESLIKTWLLQPVYQRLTSGQGRFASELRSVVFLFLKFSGLHVSGTDEAFDQQVCDKLDSYLSRLQQILHEQGGYLLKMTIDDKGSYLLASFGAPLSHEEHLVNRAIHVALLLRATSQAVNWIEQVQIAISQATVLAGIFGSPQRATFDLLGSEVNLLNRVSTQAKPGQIVVTKAIQKQAHPSYRFAPAEQVTLRNIADPVTIFELLAEAATHPSLRLPTLSRQLTHQLIGRQSERQTIERLWQQASLQQGQILLIEGAAGLGKSLLVMDGVRGFAQQNVLMLYAACERTSQHTPYQLWRLLLPALLEISQAEGANSIFDEPEGGKSDPAQRQETIFAAFQQLLKQATQQQPLLLVLDDLHWIDEASRKLTVTLSRQLADWPILLILLQRPTLSEHQAESDPPLDLTISNSPFPELSHLPNYHAATLQEFSLEEVETLLAARLGTKPSSLLLSFFMRLTQGNPFFVDELLLTLQNEGLLQQDAIKGPWTLAKQISQRLQAANCLQRNPESGDWLVAPAAPLTTVEIGLPSTIELMIHSRIDSLPEAARLTLKIASVIGRTFSHTLLAQIEPSFVDQATLAQQLQILAEKHLILVDTNAPNHSLPTRYTFRHQLTQEITYQTLTGNERRQAHQAVGDALERLEPNAIEALAEHYWQGTLREKALIYLEQAAQRAQHNAAHQAALNGYNRLLSLDRRNDWLKRKVTLLHALGVPDEEQQILEELTGKVDANDLEVYQQWGEYYEAIGNYQLASEAISHVLQRYGKNSSNQQSPIDPIYCMVSLGVVARRKGDYHTAQEQQQAALHSLSTLHGELAFASAARLLIKIYNELGAIYRQQSDYPAAIEAGATALDLSRAVGEREGEVAALTMLGGVAFYQRDFVLARQYHWQTLQVHRVSGNLAGEGAALYSLGVVDFETGHYSQAEAYFLEALTIQRITQNRWEEVNLLNVLGILSYQWGDFTDARKRLRSAIDLSQQIADKGGEASVLCNLGQILRDQGNLRAAEKKLRTSLLLAKRQDDKHLVTMCQSHLALTYLYASQPRKVIQFAKQAIKIRESIAAIELTTFDHTTLALAYWQTKKRRLALVHIDKAYQILNDCQAIGPEFPQRDYLICAQLWQANAQLDQASNALQRAYQLLYQRAAKISDPDKQASFLQNIGWHAEIMRVAHR